LAWQAAHALENLTIVGNTVNLSFDPDQETTTTVIENFETVQADDVVSDGELFQKVTDLTKITLVDNATIVADGNASNVTEGFLSGEFSHRQSFRSLFTKEFDTAQDWTAFNTFIFEVKCLDSGSPDNHGAVHLYFTNSADENSPNFTVLDAGEVTDGFELRTIDISTLTFASDIKSFTIFSDDITNVFTYFIDDIHIVKDILLPEEGTLNLRYSAGAPVVFSTLEWVTTEFPGTEIEVRARAANGTAFLTRATYTDFLNSGDNLNLEGTDVEIEVTFLPDESRVVSPVLHSVRILVLTEAEIDGFAIDTGDEFSRGETSNAQISGADITLQTPIFVDSFYFALNNAVNQSHLETPSNASSFVTPDSDGAQLSGATDTPIAPNLIFKAVEEMGTSAVVNQSSLFQPRSVRRQTGRTFVVADTFNDRILELDEDGALIAGVGSINYQADKLFPIAATIDVRTSILYLVWSRNVSFKTVNVTKITLQSEDGTKVQLIKDFDKILGLTTDQLQSNNTDGQIMPIVLSPQNAGLAQQLPPLTTHLFADGSTQDGVVPGGINVESVFYKAATGGSTLGIHCFVGNFAYIDGIFTPTWAEKTEDDGFIVANGTIAVKDYSFPTTVSESITNNTNVSSIVEIDSNNNLIFGSDVMRFSPFIPGRVQELDSTTLLIGGIKPGGVDGNPSDPLNFRSISGTADNKNLQKSILKDIFFDGSSPHFGSVIIFDKAANSTIFQYTSPEGILVSDVDVDQSGHYVVAESSFEKSGRVIKLDTVGNIVFTFGEGVYGLINDINVQIDDSIMIST
jgi:hypothetical protein